jgi:hypothetical protein
MTKINYQALALAGALLVSIVSVSPKLHADTITENFTNNPAQDGWQIFGNTNLFAWDSTNHDLAVTWDSSQPNSYFYHPLSTVIGAPDGFTLDFDLNLTDIGPGLDTNKPYDFELAIGFLNFGEATSAGFLRGTGYSSPDLAEFDYFYDDGSGDESIDATVVDSQNAFYFAYDYTQGLANSVKYHVSLAHNSGDEFITGAVYTYDTNGVRQLYSSLPYTYLETGFGDWFTDTISISSYNDTDAYGGSILAHGTVANLIVTTSPRPVGNVTTINSNGLWQVSFSGRSGWNYTLRRSTDLQSWSDAGTAIGSNSILTIQDTNAPATRAFYRVSAQKQ